MAPAQTKKTRAKTKRAEPVTPTPHCSNCPPKYAQTQQPQNTTTTTLTSNVATNSGTLVSTASAVSGTASILGSWQICHAVCLVIVSALAAIGITLTGMPLAFLTTWAVPLWTIALVLLFLTIALHAAKKCVSVRIIILNTGLIIAGTPFEKTQPYQPLFWIIGGTIVAVAIIQFIQHWRKQHEKNA